MSSPLVTWVKTFGQLGDKEGNMLSEYTELVDGIFLNKVMNQINPKGTVQGLNKVNNDVSQRAQNLSVLIYHIKSYYQETLHQLIMMSPPNVLLLGRNPVCEEGLEEIRKLLLLLLGCVVQCERKEEYIEKIQSLDFDTKAAIAAHIQEVTHCQENVFDLHWLEMEGLCPEEWENLCRSMSINLKMLVDQRDRQFEAIVELMQGKETIKSVVFGDDSSLTEPTSSRLPLSQQHLALELTDAKAKIKRLRQELEEKSEQLLDCRQDLDSVEAELKRLQQENMQLLTDARAARMYRDELDAMKERAIRADKLESEAMLEEELQSVKPRSDKLHHLEKHNLLLESKLHDMEEERTVDRRRIEELLERNVILELSQKRSMEESQRLGWELELAKNPQQNSETELKSLGQEVTEKTCSRLLKLEKDNQKLLKALEELQGTSCPLDGFISESKHIEENGRMDIVDSKTLKSTSECANMHNGQMITQTNTNGSLHCIEVELNELENENQSSQISINQNQGLMHENGHLKQDKSCLEKENRKLRQQVKIQEASLDSSNLKLVVLEKENRTLVKKTNYLSEACAKNKELEKENQELIQQAGVDKRMLMTLREELLDQRLKLQQKESDFEKLTYDLERMRLNQETRMGDHEAVDQGLRKREWPPSRPVKQNYEALLQRDEEEKAGQCSPPERTWHRESQEATWALLKLKDRLIEVERNNATLQAEKQALQTQLQTLQAQSDGLQAQIIALQQQTASLQESNTALQTHNAQLQRERQSSEAEREGAIREREDLRTVNELLLRDHERLSVLHERQAAELEVLSHRYSTMENSHRTLDIEHRSLEDRYNTLLQQRAQLEGLNQTYQKLLAENEGLQVEHKSIKTQLNSCKLEQTQLESELSKLKEQNQQLEISSIKLANQCELLTQLKGNLEEENRHLLDQIQSLMLQNRTLLDQTMESKDLFHVEQRQYIDKLNELRRQKEKLEEKIMDQYKFYDPSPPRRRGNWITLKMRKLIKTRTRDQEHVRSSTPQLRSESCEGLDDLRIHDNRSSVGSQGSEESASNSLNGDTVSPKRSSSEYNLSYMKLSQSSHSSQEHPETSNSVSSKPLIPTSQGQEKENEAICGRRLTWGSHANDSYHKFPSFTMTTFTNFLLSCFSSLVSCLHVFHCGDQVSTLKMFHVKRNKPKDKDKVKSLFRRSLSMNDLLQSEGCLDEDSGQQEDQPEEQIMQRTIAISKKHSTSSSSFHHYSFIDNHTVNCNQGKDFQGDTVPPRLANGNEGQDHGLNGKSSRAPSASSGEFSVSLENEAWSSDSSPHPDPLSSSRQRFSDSPSPARPNHEELRQGYCSSGSGVRRTSSGRSAGERSAQKLDKASIGLYKTQSVQSTESDPKPALEAQGKSSSVSGCLNCFATPMRSPKTGQAVSTLPRASCVISTSEGNSRRASVHSTMSVKSVGSVSSKNGAEPQPDPSDEVLKESLVLKEEDHKPEHLFDSAFTIDSVFTNTIFSE
ncbi:Girdin [Labeo rohita]|uniref:Girdin n=1 Tax=Labeo rohita TaxID=84645 RepID=A0ABQ8MK58_LABRO|nr:Girdin [Labeo rohita]